MTRLPSRAYISSPYPSKRCEKTPSRLLPAKRTSLLISVSNPCVNKNRSEFFGKTVRDLRKAAPKGRHSPIQQAPHRHPTPIPKSPATPQPLSPWLPVAGRPLDSIAINLQERASVGLVRLQVLRRKHAAGTATASMPFDRWARSTPKKLPLPRNKKAAGPRGIEGRPRRILWVTRRMARRSPDHCYWLTSDGCVERPAERRPAGPGPRAPCSPVRESRSPTARGAAWCQPSGSPPGRSSTKSSD